MICADGLWKSRMQNSKKILLLAVILVTAVIILHARGNRQPAPNIVQVRGLVRIVGNNPFSEPAISNSDDIWYMERSERQQFYALQHSIVTVEGEETVTEFIYVSGDFGGYRRELRNIRIISVEPNF